MKMRLKPLTLAAYALVLSALVYAVIWRALETVISRAHVIGGAL